MDDPFECHHSKISIYVYEDKSLRVAVSTANLCYEDWNHYNQELWLSPLCPRLPESSSDTDGESPTSFKSDLLNYLKDYKRPCLKDFIDFVRRADFSAVKVFLVYSVPGWHFPDDNTGCHLHKVANILNRYCDLSTTSSSEDPLSWDIIAQAPSLDYMGRTPFEWLRSAFLRSIASHTKSRLPKNSNANLKIIFPTIDNVMNGYFDLEIGECLCYPKIHDERQGWLRDYLRQWKADGTGRTKIMPHRKSYCRVSPCQTKLAFYMITSANISKAAWGGRFGSGMMIFVRSYEAGVMFLPKLFNEEFFEIKSTPNGKNKQLFPFMCDLPLVPYESDDNPWCK